MNHTSRVFSVFLLAFSLFLPLAAFGHGSLLLKSTISEKTYTTTVNPDGSFSFKNIPQGSYTLSITGSKRYFTAMAGESSSSITVQNLQWLATGNGVPSSNVMMSSVSVTSDMVSNPYYNVCSDPKKEYSVILYSSLVTTRRANLSGRIANFAGSHESVVSR